MFHVNVSTGYLAKIVREVCDSMKFSYDELSAAVQKEDHVHCDETGLKENGKDVGYGSDEQRILRYSKLIPHVEAKS